jgi:hypothetical protein
VRCAIQRAEQVALGLVLPALSVPGRQLPGDRCRSREIMRPDRLEERGEVSGFGHGSL